MADGIHCTCGEILVEEVTETGVRLVGADEPIVFRRTTDHVVCPSCFLSYDVRSLIAQAVSRRDVDFLEQMAADAEGRQD